MNLINFALIFRTFYRRIDIFLEIRIDLRLSNLEEITNILPPQKINS
jgi:hypothetical protein